MDPAPPPPPLPRSLPATLRAFLTRRSLRSLSEQDRRQLLSAQIEATRPIVSGVLLSGALILGLTGAFELFGLSGKSGYPWWLVGLVALCVAGLALAVRTMADWRMRLVLTLVSTLLVGVFMSVPPPGAGAALSIRTGLFHLMPIALLALLVRRASALSMAALMLALAVVRVELHGMPPSGLALYWLGIVTSIGFGLLLSGYVTDFAAENYRIRQRLRQQASTDELTGLRNRGGWNRDAEEAYALAVKRGLPASFAFFDIDHFKDVNDRHGHEAGDGVLQCLGQIIRERLGRGTIAARMGGEEFVVLFTDVAPESVEGYVQRVRLAFEEACRDKGVTVSAGVAHRQPAESMGQHLRRADAALYEAKDGGRDRMVVARA